jgi:hypothetical protein
VDELPEVIGPCEKFVDESGDVGLRQQLVAPDESVENPDMWVEVPAPPPKADPLATMLSIRLPDVTKYLRTHNCRIYFSNTIKRGVSRHLGFESWSPAIREHFMGGFTTILSDPVFLRAQVLAALTSENGAALSVEKIAETVILAAGWMAFSLAAAECNP